jgi:hypothetical protein
VAEVDGGATSVEAEDEAEGGVITDRALTIVVEHTRSSPGLKLRNVVKGDRKHTPGRKSKEQKKASAARSIRHDEVPAAAGLLRTVPLGVTRASGNSQPTPFIQQDARQRKFIAARPVPRDGLLKRQVTLPSKEHKDIGHKTLYTQSIFDFQPNGFFH